MDCKQGPNISLIKHEQKFLIFLSTYKVYRGSLAPTTIITRDVAKAGYTESFPPTMDQTAALHKKVSAKAQSRILIKSPKRRNDDFMQGIKTAYLEGAQYLPLFHQRDVGAHAKLCHP